MLGSHVLLTMVRLSFSLEATTPKTKCRSTLSLDIRRSSLSYNTADRSTAVAFFTTITIKRSKRQLILITNLST